MLRTTVSCLLFGLVALAGCAQGGDGGDAGASAGDGLPDAPIAAGDGRLCVVAVDAAIRPVVGASIEVRVGGGDPVTALTGEDGQACVDLPPGTYFIAVTHVHQTYRPAQTTADVEDGKETLVKVQLERVFEQEPYHVTMKFEGFIQCGYAISGVMSSLCVNDYTHFVGPYTCPECEHLFDRRSYNFAVEAGWQTQVFEMTWDPTAQGTSELMRLTISHFPRSASHWYCGGASTDPVLVRMEVGEVCEDQQDEPELVPPEGLPNMHLFAATNAPPGQPASVAFNQGFAVFINQFYYGKPPPDWTFIGGSEFPF